MTDEELKEESFQKLLEEIAQKNYCKAMRYCKEGRLLDDAIYVEKLKQLPAGNTNFYIYALASKLKDVKDKDLENVIALCEKEEFQEEGKLQLIRVKCLIKLKEYEKAIAICNHFIAYEGFFLQNLKCLFLQKQYEQILLLTDTPQYQKDYLVEEYRIKALMKQRKFSEASEIAARPCFDGIKKMQEYKINFNNYFALMVFQDQYSLPNQNLYTKMLENIFIQEISLEEIEQSSFLYYEKVLFKNVWNDVCGGLKSKKDLEECGTLFLFSKETKRKLKKKQNFVDFWFYMQLFFQMSSGYQYVFRVINELVQNKQLEEANALVLMYRLHQDKPDLLECISRGEPPKEFLYNRKVTL